MAKGKAKGFLFMLDKSLGEEAYTIEITPSKAMVKASAFPGFFYAIQTLYQLLPVQIYGKHPVPEASWRIPAVTIRDEPRFRYRGFMVDSGRHFFSVDEIKKVIDMMAIYKMNRLHWHLTEDQGWRFESKKYPRLTEIGAFRNGTMIGKDHTTNDGIRYGGYYTQDEMRELVAYAQKKNITIIPEIDLPGHMQSALAAYPNLGCTGGPYEVATTWGIKKEVLCAGKEEVYTFLEDILTELIARASVGKSARTASSVLPSWGSRATTSTAPKTICRIMSPPVSRPSSTARAARSSAGTKSWKETWPKGLR